MGPQNVRKSRAMFTKKIIALEQNEISSPNLIHMLMTKIFGQKKINAQICQLVALKTQKNCSRVTGGPIDLKFGIRYLCSKGNKRLYGHLHISKNMAAIGQTNSNTY